MPAVPFRVLLISAGAVLGANARYWVGVLFTRLTTTGFPWATLTVNVSGSLLLGGFAGWAARQLPNPGWALVLAVGFCGAYTTFSTFGLELFAMLQGRNVAQALAYVAASVVLSAGAVALGWSAGQALAGMPR
ncbi:MAG TPA: fluoride efflux transporter CrcB [Candidatus Angelobacter sp.]|jgi:CrcB protein|nr:fluoride efflux transporter CrcB [Candidatus Angelobacter sp.]